ncbi:hypothetical protein KUTeg_006790 [Tegillarca granosa]|uniref:Uncharacterized protein n=1 Tax=Tegillarca granosa TaxID=220873 RepID=A0ABQ9FG33_TEGGR|nr:hypothetical protein KUTeg_006790 [Tegillarca granosa]
MVTILQYIQHNQTIFLDAAEHSKEYASIDGVSLHPDPVILPGDLTVGAHVQVKKDITSPGLKMNVEIYKFI